MHPTQHKRKRVICPEFSPSRHSRRSNTNLTPRNLATGTWYIFCREVKLIRLHVMGAAICRTWTGHYCQTLDTPFQPCFRFSSRLRNTNTRFFAAFAFPSEGCTGREFRQQPQPQQPHSQRYPPQRQHSPDSRHAHPIHCRSGPPALPDYDSANLLRR